jgi:hypothetical protein
MPTIERERVLAGTFGADTLVVGTGKLITHVLFNRRLR